MDETYREHYPLLCDESPEEHYAGRHYHRDCLMTYRSRARNNMKGAVAILTRWPDHWSTFVTYLWLGLATICLTTFIVYNTLFSFSTLSSPSPMPAKFKSSTTLKPYKKAALAHVYMHFVVNHNNKIYLNEYLPLIEDLTNNYTEFYYHLIIVQNDTLNGNDELSAERNNENALDFVLNEDINFQKQISKTDNIKIEQISLTRFMDESPAGKYWRLLSHEFVEFLIRAISIWEKGGIAFNPLVLKSQLSILYIEKLKKVFKKFKHKNISHKPKLYNGVHKDAINSKRVNNIRDVINALENENNSNDSIDEMLIQDENKNNLLIVPGGRKLFTTIEKNKKEKNKDIKYAKVNPTISQDFNQTTKMLINYSTVKKDELQEILQKDDNSSINSLLPVFLNFLYHRYNDKSDIETILTNNIEKPTSDGPIVNDYEISTTLKNTNKKHYLNSLKIPDDKLEMKMLSPMIIPSKQIDTITGKPKWMIEFSNNDENQITIDVKGNIIATETKCHAFLGTIFNYASHQESKNNLTDFIITQLSIFCKGVFSSCIGIDLILL